MPLTKDLTKFTTASPAIATFSYVDLINGLGYETFYSTVSEDNAATSYLLVPITDRSAEKTVPSTGAGTEYNFDSSVFNEPRTVKGTAYLSVETHIAAGTLTLAVILYKVTAASAEVALSSTITETGDNATNTINFITLPLTETLIQSGEKLRLSITATSSGGTDGIVGTDPAGRASGSLTDCTNKLSVPFKIDR